MTTTNRITLTVDGQTWVAMWSGPHAADVVASFGTPIIPTPYTVAIPKAVVAERIRALNPGVEVL